MEVITGQRSTLRSNNATPTRTSPKKHSFSLSQIIPTHLLCQMQANSPGVEFLGTTFGLRKRHKFHCCLFTYSIKCKIRHLHVVVVQKRAKKCTTKRDTCAKLLFLLIKPIVFLKSSLPSGLLDL